MTIITFQAISRMAFLFALGGEHKQNKLSEINNENMNGLLRLAQPGSRPAPWSSSRRYRARAAALPAKGGPRGGGTRRGAGPARGLPLALQPTLPACS